MNAHDSDLVYGLVAWQWYMLLLKRSPKLTVEKRIGFMCLCCFCTYQCSGAKKTNPTDIYSLVLHSVGMSPETDILHQDFQTMNSILICMLTIKQQELQHMIDYE